MTLPVTSCADDGSAGTLRQVVLSANSGDIVDLGSLMCSTITLTGGAITFGADELTFQGPGAARLAIDGNNADRVFRHDGSGTLAFYDLAVRDGAYANDYAAGGCIYSAGSVALTRSTVSSCTLSGTTNAAGGAIVALESVFLDHAQVSASSADAAQAVGGGIFASTSVSLLGSTISGNSASTSPAGAAAGGGVATAGTFSAKYSTITGNQTIGGDSGAGGLLVLSSPTAAMTIVYSTIDHNHSRYGGGLLLGDGPSTATIRNSTISSNSGGGIFAIADVALRNSTVAFNTAGTQGAGGLTANGGALDLESTILAGNTPGDGYAADLDGSATVTGSNNLIESSGIPVPVGTITGDPHLKALEYNGGVTRTHALVADSVAIDTGANPSGLLSDQRGPGYPRVVGASADIGAFEFNLDLLFGDGFDN